jgi:glycosyltransferase involved in cell wall biosynthesis
MKICIVSDYLPGFHRIWSGAELLAVTLGEMLKENSCEILFLTTPWDFEPKDGHDQVRAVRTPAKRLGTLSRNFPLDIVALWSLYRRLKNYRPDVVHINAKYLFLPTLIVCSRLNIPTVFTVPDYFIFCPTTFIRKPDGTACTLYHGAHCCDCLSAISNGTTRKILARIPKCFSKAVLALRAKQFDYFLKKVSAYITLTKLSKQRLVGYGIPDEKINIIYHYRLAKPRESNVSISNPSAVFAGWLSEENGTDILVKAFALTVREIPHAKLYLVGTGSDSFIEQLKKHIAAGNVTDNVIFLGNRDNQEALSIISKCDVVVVPHQWAKEFGPVILLEAMALGKPVITSKIGATEEFVVNGKNGFLVSDFKNAGVFAEKLVRLLSDARLARQMGERGKSAVSFLTDSSTGEMLLNLYRKLMDQESRCAVDTSEKRG